MSPLRVLASSSWPPELGNRRLVQSLLALGLAGMLTELASTAYVPRLVLFLTVLAFGVVGLVRCRRADQRRGGESLATPPLADGEAMAGALH